jgi:ADP-ribosylglycohydrolase
MALSVVSTLNHHQAINQDDLAHSLAEHYDRSRGYGLATWHILSRIKNGENWRDVAPDAFKGTGSFGNGAAVRAGPIGAYFATDLDAVIANARLSAEVTHAHPEAIAGAIAVAVAAALAWQSNDKVHTRQTFLEELLPFVPESDVKQGIVRARDLPSTTTAYSAAAELGNGSQVSCQDTVPFALWCAAECLRNYENAIWLTLQGLGDSDTNCAIVGSIVALSAPPETIPAVWQHNREPLPNWTFSEE